mgnify:CR=1 FL=1
MSLAINDHVNLGVHQCQLFLKPAEKLRGIVKTSIQKIITYCQAFCAKYSLEICAKCYCQYDLRTAACPVCQKLGVQKQKKTPKTNTMPDQINKVFKLAYPYGIEYVSKAALTQAPSLN